MLPEIPENFRWFDGSVWVGVGGCVQHLTEDEEGNFTGFDFIRIQSFTDLGRKRSIEGSEHSLTYQHREMPSSYQSFWTIGIDDRNHLVGDYAKKVTCSSCPNLMTCVLTGEPKTLEVPRA